MTVKGIFSTPTMIGKTGISAPQGIFSNPTMIGGITGGASGPVPQPSGIVDKITGAVSGAISGATAQARQLLSGLAPGGGILAKAASLTGTNISFTSGQTGSTANSTTAEASDMDWRVRVSVNPNSGVLYRATGNSLMYPLVTTDGVIFPYVPTVNVVHAARYGSQALTHTNYTHYFYESSEVQTITISGDFSVQNNKEGQYFLAALYFFRGATKMFYSQGKYQGSPPPIVYLDGYGAHYLPHVPCVVTNFSHTMPADVDYLEINGTDRVPVLSTFTINFQPLYSRAAVREFDHDSFAKGALLDKGFI